MDVQAFSIKEGPTESGDPSPPMKPIIDAVGGELLPFELLEVLPKYWIIILALLLPAFIILFKKRDTALNLISRII
jgi:hypothetical protein